MPLSLDVQLDNNGNPKRKQFTGATLYMQELRKTRPEFRQFGMFSPEMIRAGMAEFDRLSMDEQMRYEQMAKAQKKKYDTLYGDQFRRDCEGVHLSEREKLASLRSQYESYTADIVAEMAGRLTDSAALADTEFVVGEVFTFVNADERDKGVCVPAEFGFVRFSLGLGVIDSLHCIVQPRKGAIPVHLTSQCRDIMEDTHGIPTYGCAEAEESMVRMCIRLKSLCSTSADRPDLQLPIFVPTERLEAMQKALIYAFNDPNMCRDGCPFVREIGRAKNTKVFPFESLFLAIMRNTCIPPEKRLTSFLDLQVTQLLNRPRYTGEEHACQLHRREDNLPHCALMKAHIYAWALFGYAVPALDLAWRSSHGPKELDVPVPRPVKVGWLTRGNRRLPDSCPSNLASIGRSSSTISNSSRPAYVQRMGRQTAAGAAASVAASTASVADSEIDQNFDDASSLASVNVLTGEFHRALSFDQRTATSRQDCGIDVGAGLDINIGVVGRGRGRGRPRAGAHRGPIIID